MGCTASKVANEDTVRRCKERRGLMKDAVRSRHHLAVAHSNYIRSLRTTAKALSRFSEFQSLVVSDHTPPVLIHQRQSDVSTLPPPLLLPSSASPSVSVRTDATLHSRFQNLPPHQQYEESEKKNAFSKRSTYSTTASQTSSAWNWENFYPPSPPGSDFFDVLEQNRRECMERGKEDQKKVEIEDRDSISFHNSRNCFPREDEEEELGITSSNEEGEDAEMTDSDYRGSYATSVEHRQRQQRSVNTRSILESETYLQRKVEEEVDDSSALVRNLSTVVKHRDLKEIAAAIEEQFEKAASAGDGLSNLLEIGRVWLDRKALSNSNIVLSNLPSTWSSKPPLMIKALVDSGGKKSLCSTLDRLLAWEKKLYEEVKARERVKIEHKKKLSTLQNLEYKGMDAMKLQKIKTLIQKLHSLIMVTSQAVSATSSAIIEVIDNELAPQLVELCYRCLNMWRSMNHFHEIQNLIVQQVRGLVNYSATTESTSDLHRQATLDLESAVSCWHSSFTRLISFHRHYIKVIHSWLGLTLFQVSSDESPKDHPSSLVSSELLAFCDDWRQALERLPDTVASESIKGFITVVHSISLKQAEEFSIKKRAECYSKELERKTVALRKIERKFYQSHSSVGIALPDADESDIHGQKVFDRRDPFSEKKLEIATCRRKVEDEMSSHTKAVKVTREMTLNNIQTGLPGVFQAMTGFSGLFMEALEGVFLQTGHYRLE
ncbi:hypothetical protein ZOSMA_28G01150 [Zostera marina]|uniref:DUF632 domain-containing protein n=1 Tax=Zostera marina TaxID=29655 RepID=A0A0K9PEW5_ZOSMR|nr:hypothetical protein ZOSMA_28G01150 [Zostera marina]